MRTKMTWGAALLGAVLATACGGGALPTAPDAPAPRVALVLVVSPLEVSEDTDFEISGRGFPPGSEGFLYVVRLGGEVPPRAVKNFMFPGFEFPGDNKLFSYSPGVAGEYEMWLFAPSLGSSERIKVKVTR